MSILETFEQLDSLTEGGPGGQRTYKDFLVFLAEFLGCSKPSAFNADWVLHHSDCNHNNNSDFANLVLMNSAHHISFHKQLPKEATKADMEYLLKNGTTKDGTKFEYWQIGLDIAARINKVQTEPDITEIIKEPALV